MISRAVWLVGILVVAFVTASVQLDRQARFDPALSGIVPEPFRAFAQRHVTAQALGGEDDALALSQARKLVARRPMPAEHLRMLSLAELEAGEAEQSVYSIQLAARRGWRDRSAQQTMLNLALAAGDEAEAARRFAALFVRGGVDDTQLRSLALTVFPPGSEVARAEFAQILAGADRWHQTYLRKGSSILPTEVFVDLTARASEAGVKFDCKQAERASKGLRRTDCAAGEALDAILSHCP